MKTSSLLFAPLCGWLMAAIAAAQTPAVAPSSTPAHTKRVILHLKHLPVQVVEGTVRNLVAGDQPVRVVGEPATNRIIIDAPEDFVAGVVDLIDALDHPRPTVTIHVREVVMSAASAQHIRSGPTADVLRSIERSSQKGELQVIDRMQLTVAENTEGMLQIGQQVAVVTEQQGRPGQTRKSYNFQQVGTIFQATPQLSGNAVRLEFLFEKSDLVTDSEDAEGPPAIVTTTTRSTVRIPADSSVVIGGMRMGPDRKAVHWRLILATEVHEFDN